MKAAGPPVPPCHPTQSAPNKDDCTKPSCIFIDSLTPPLEAAKLDVAAVPCELPFIAMSIGIQPSLLKAPTFRVAMFTLHDRVVTFHQFLI